MFIYWSPYILARWFILRTPRFAFNRSSLMERHITCHTKFESAFQISRVATLRRKTRVTRAATGRSADLMWEIFIYSDGQIGESTLAALFELRYIRHNVNGQTPTVTWCNIDVSTNITICTLMIDAETGEDSWDSIRRFFCFRFRFVFFQIWNVMNSVQSRLVSFRSVELFWLVERQAIDHYSS